MTKLRVNGRAFSDEDRLSKGDYTVRMSIF